MIQPTLANNERSRFPRKHNATVGEGVCNEKSRTGGRQGYDFSRNSVSWVRLEIKWTMPANMKFANMKRNTTYLAM